MKQVFFNFPLIVMMLISNASTVVAASGGNMIGSAAPQSQQAADPIVVSSVNFDELDDRHVDAKRQPDAQLCG